MDSLVLTTPESHALIEAFEAAQRHGHADLADHLPARDDASFLSLATELVRIDLEYRWQQGEGVALEHYRPIVPEVFADPLTLSAVAYEEYRLRVQRGQRVSPGDYARRYNIDTEAWPTAPDQSIKNDTNRDESLDSVHREAVREIDLACVYPAVGDRLGPFELVNEIGRGTFARAYLATQSELSNRPVVLKVSPAGSIEADHLARLQHTNIVPVYSVHHEGPWCIICMPYLGTVTLADLTKTIGQGDNLPRSGTEFLSTLANCAQKTVVADASANGVPRPERHDASLLQPPNTPDQLPRSSYIESILRLMSQLAAGLSHAHDRGIVHRDLKPANILLASDGRPMILDFNLSDDLVVGGRASLMVGGTLPYMAPEHLRAVRAGGHVDRAADLYSLGVILYELLTGRRPFPDHKGNVNQAIDSMLAERSQAPPNPRRLNRDITPAIAAIISRCLAPNPVNRYQSAAELHDDLERHLRHRPLRHAANDSLTERAKKWARRHPRLSSSASIGSISAMVLVAVAALWVARADQLEQIHAAQTYQQFQRELPNAFLALSLPELAPSAIPVGLDEARSTLQPYGVLTDRDWQQREAVASLDLPQRNQLKGQMSHLMYLMARGLAVRAAAADTDDRQALSAEALRINTAALELCPTPSGSRTLHWQRERLLGPSSDDSRGASLVTGDTQPSDLFFAVLKSLEEHRYEEAGSHLREMRAARPTDPFVWLISGRVHRALDDLEQAVACYSVCIGLHPNAYLAYLDRATCLMLDGDHHAALADLNKVLELVPGLAAALQNRGLVHAALGNLPQAEADLTAALEAEHAPTRLYFERSRIRTMSGDSTGALEDRRVGLQLTPRDELSWVARGFAKMRSDAAGAVDDFRQALELNPHSKFALENLIHVLADRLHRHDNALAAVNRLLTIDESHLDARASRAVLLARMGQQEQARTAVANLLGQSPPPKTLFQCACALSLLSHDDTNARRALAILCQAVEGDAALVVRAKTDPDLEALRKLPEFSALEDGANSLRKLRRQLVETAPSVDHEPGE